MSLKSGGKFEEKLNCCFTNDKNLLNFDLSTRNSQNFYFIGSFCVKFLAFDLKRYWGVIFHDTAE